MDVLPAFLSHLGNERRMAARTVEAYGSDLAMFFGFLRLHLGTEPSLKALSGLKARDIRAYLAARRRDVATNARTVAAAVAAARRLSEDVRRAAEPGSNLAGMDQSRDVTLESAVEAADHNSFDVAAAC